MNANAASDADDEAAPEDGDPVYAYRPNLMGSAWVFSLKRDGLAWEYGRRSGLVRYDQVQRVRMSFKPATLQTQRFVTEIWSPQNPKLTISSTSFRSLMEQARQDTEYTGFVTELHRRFASARSTAHFESGMNPVLYWLGVAVFAGIGLVLFGFLIRTLATPDLTGAAVIGGVIALLVWQAGMIFYRNRPLIYRADAPPQIVLPRG